MSRFWSIAAYLACAVIATTAAAQELVPPPSPAAADADKSVRISFVPPPLEGTISLGIYDNSKALVRVLHREADLEEFEIGTDALVTAWDGKNDAGARLPPGKYHAHGYVVADLAVEGVGFFFNDWVSDEQSPRIEKIFALRSRGTGFVIKAQLRDGSTENFVCDEQGRIAGMRNELPPSGDCAALAGAAALTDGVDCSAGKDGTLWVIDRTAKGSAQTEVKQFASDKELLRRLSIPADQPQPQAIAASTSQDRIFLLEENANVQRVRALSLAATTSDSGQAVSDWKVEFEKKIVRHQEFSLQEGKPVVGAAGKAGADKVKIRLEPNPLEKDKSATLEITAACDAASSFLKTADGLPLQTISETPGLKRVVLAPAGEKSIEVYQDDGVVVEQFRVGRLDEMMAFDCGEFELK